MPENIPEASAYPTVEPNARPHSGLVVTLIVVASIIGVFATVAVWARRQALDSDEWARTSGKLLADPTIDAALSNYLVSTLFASVDVRAQLQASLPPNIQPLAVPATTGLRLLGVRAAELLLQQPAVQTIWEEANRAAHKTMMAALSGGSDVLSTTGGVVTLNVVPLIEQVGAQLGLDVQGKIPPDVGTIPVLRSNQLALAQIVAWHLRFWSILLPFLSLFLLTLAVYFARGWRRRALEDVGVALVVVGAVVLIARGVGGSYLVGSVATTQAMEPVARSVWGIGTSLLLVSAVSLAAYGFVILVGAWLAGPTPIASRVRSWIAPALERRGIAYAILGVILVLIFWWQPTPSTQRLLPSLFLIVLAIAGFEAIRIVTLREAAAARRETEATEYRHEVETPQPPQRKIG